MKNLFGVNIAHSKKNDIIDGADFITKRLSSELQNKFDFCFNEGKSQKETLPLPLMIIQIISMIFLGLTFVTNIKSIFERKLFVAFHKMPYLYLVEIINILIFILLKVLEILKKKQVIMCEEDAETNNLCEKVIEECYAELDIPDDTKTELIEVLKFKYKIKNGKEKLISFGTYDYAHPEYIAYIQDESLCFSDIDWVMGIPFHSTQ